MSSTPGDPAPAWTPSYVHAARAAADRALAEASEFADTDLTKMAIATAVRELAAEVRALRHQLTGNLPPRGGGLMAALKDIEHSIDLIRPA